MTGGSINQKPAEGAEREPNLNNHGLDVKVADRVSGGARVREARPRVPLRRRNGSSGDGTLADSRRTALSCSGR